MDDDEVLEELSKKKQKKNFRSVVNSQRLDHFELDSVMMEE